MPAMAFPCPAFLAGWGAALLAGSGLTLLAARGLTLPTVVLLVIALSGTLWVMYHLTHNMMPMSASDMSQMP